MDHHELEEHNPAMSALARPNRLLWTYDETVALISIFEEKRIQDALGNTVRNFHIYDVVSGKMKEMGYFRTPNQCRVKMKNLKSEYRGARALDAKVTGKKVPAYFPLLEGLFGPRFDAGDLSPTPSPLEDDASKDYEAGGGNRVLTSPSSRKGKNALHSANADYYTEPVEWKRRRQMVSSYPSNFYLDDDSEGKSPLPEELDHLDNGQDGGDEDEELKNMEWSGSERKHKSLSSKAERKIHALKVVMESITNQFLEHQEAAEQRFYEFERERMQHEAEMEEKRMMFLREETERQNQDEERREAMIMQVLERILMVFENSTQGSVSLTSKKT